VKDQEKIAELRHMLRVEQEKTRAMEEKLNRILEIVLLQKHSDLANRSLHKRLGMCAGTKRSVWCRVIISSHICCSVCVCLVIVRSKVNFSTSLSM